MAGYGWEEYDVRTGGSQIIRDQGNMIDIQTQFVKVEGGEHGWSHLNRFTTLNKLTDYLLGGHWGVRITGTLRADGKELCQSQDIL